MIDRTRFPRLSAIDAPADLRRLPEAELPAVANELRDYLIESVGRSGGHFGAGLGVVELTVALHWLYDTPTDRVVWDVGHQAYPHKILTGRRDQIESVKRRGGLAPGASAPSSFVASEPLSFMARGWGKARAKANATRASIGVHAGVNLDVISGCPVACTAMLRTS